MNHRHLVLALALGCTSMESGANSHASLNYWYCLRDPTALTMREPGRVQYVLPVVDFDSQPSAPRPVPGLEMTVCTSATCIPEFPQCGAELGQCFRTSPGPAPYVMILDFPYGFANGVLRFRAPGYVDMDYLLGGPMIGTPAGEMIVRGIGVPLLLEATRDSIYGQVGLSSVDATRGVLAARTLDCRGERASGVLVQPWLGDVEPPAVAFRLSNNNYAAPATLETDERGVVGFINLAPQSIDVIAVAPDGATFVSPTTINIRPNVITLAELRMGLGQWGQ